MTGWDSEGPDDWHAQQRIAQESGEHSRPPTGYLPRSTHEWVERISPTVLVKQLAPVLALVGAAGMNSEDREEWMMAAAMALEHLPEDLVRIGLKAAMRKADHPSKVVAIAIAETEELYRTRKRISSTPRPPGADALPAPGKARPTAAEVDEIMAEHGIASHKPKPIETRVLRNPTVADYVELGLTTEQAQEAVRTLLPAPRQTHDGQIGKHLPEQRGDEQAEAVG